MQLISIWFQKQTQQCWLTHESREIYIHLEITQLESQIRADRVERPRSYSSVSDVASLGEDAALYPANPEQTLSNVSYFGKQYFSEESPVSSWPKSSCFLNLSNLIQENNIKASKPPPHVVQEQTISINVQKETPHPTPPQMDPRLSLLGISSVGHPHSVSFHLREGFVLEKMNGVMFKVDRKVWG